MTVTDAATGLPIAGVCIYAGPPSGCPDSRAVTDATGHWAIDFPSVISSWSFNLEHPAYLSISGHAVTQANPSLAIAMTHR